MINIIPFCLFLFLSCSIPIDYFGNSVDLRKDKLILLNLKADSLDKDILYLTFALQASVNPSIELDNPILERYFKLIMNYYGYDEMEILNHNLRGIIQPRFYITINFK